MDGLFDWTAEFTSRLVELPVSLRLWYDDFLRLPPNERNKILIPSSVALIAVVILFFACCKRFCKCVRQSCRRCCRCVSQCCIPSCCCPSEGGSAYLRLERSAKEVSARCRLALLCSLKICWISIPIPYVSCSCTEDDPSDDTSQQQQHWQHWQQQQQQHQRWWSHEQPPPGGHHAGHWRYAPQVDDDDSDSDAEQRRGSLGKAHEPVVTEVVGLQLKGEWSGPLRIWLSSVDTLHPGLRLRSRAAAREPPPPPTLLYGHGGSGGRESGVTTVAFEQPVTLRAGFEASLAVQLEPRKTDTRSPDGRPKPPVMIGAGETSLAVYDDPEPMYDVVTPRQLRTAGAPAPSTAMEAMEEAAAPPATTTVIGGVPAAVPPRPVAVGSPRVALSPRAGYSGRGGGAYYGACSPRYADTGRYPQDQMCSPSANSMATAKHRQRHGGLS